MIYIYHVHKLIKVKCFNSTRTSYYRHNLNSILFNYFETHLLLFFCIILAITLFSLKQNSNAIYIEILQTVKKTSIQLTKLYHFYFINLLFNYINQ